jgi:hypothetical protein
MGVQGETGMGVGCVCSSSAGECGLKLPLPFAAPGSRKEKKLCDMECLWWCPLLEADPDAEDDVDDDLVINSGVGSPSPSA